MYQESFLLYSFLEWQGPYALTFEEFALDYSTF